MRKTTVLAALASMVVALAVAVVSAEPAQALPNCNQTPLPVACGGEPLPKVVAPSISETRVTDYYPFVKITVAYGAKNAFRTVLQECNDGWYYDSGQTTCTSGWTTMSSESGGAGKSWADPVDKSIFFTYAYRVLAYDSVNTLVATKVLQG